MEKYNSDFFKKSFIQKDWTIYKFEIDELFNNLVIQKNDIIKRIKFINKPCSNLDWYIFKTYKKYIQIDKERIKNIFQDDFYNTYIIWFYNKF